MRDKQGLCTIWVGIGAIALSVYWPLLSKIDPFSLLFGAIWLSTFIGIFRLR